jgi:thioredoxin reductase
LHQKSLKTVLMAVIKKDMKVHKYPVIVIGGGPVGMAATAHLAERDIPFLLFEAGSSVGSNVLDWGHVRIFSPWRYNIDKASERLLRKTEWSHPNPEDLPTGRQLVENYLLPLSNHPSIKENIHLSAKVISVSRKGIDKVRSAGRDVTPFLVRVEEDGRLRSYEAAAIIDSSGTWRHPNPLGAGGLPAAGEYHNAGRIVYRIPDIMEKEKTRYANKSVMVIGAGHSAINSLLELGKLKEEAPHTKLHWVLLSNDVSKIYGGREKDALEARGALGIRIEALVNAGTLEIHSPYFIHGIENKNGNLQINGYLGNTLHEIMDVDEIIVNTGARPDLSFLKELRVQTDAALECAPGLAELIDPNIHSCGTVRPHGELELRHPEQNFYIAGVKSYGRAPTFLMATGYEQVRSIVAYLDGDIEAARRVELDLPETGVCNSGSGNSNEGACCSPAVNNEPQKSKTNKMEKTGITMMTETMEEPQGCCGGAPAKNADACCKLDEEKKDEGLEGCGCSAPSDSKTSKVKEAACCG